MMLSGLFNTENPALLWLRRARFDLLLALLVFFVMLDRLTGNPVHEGAALVLAALVILHLRLNRFWFERILFQTESYRKAAGIFRILVNTLLIASALGSFFSGIMVSQSLFSAFTPLIWQSDLELRAAHVTWSMVFFAASALHAGLHWDLWLKTLRCSEPFILRATVFLAAFSAILLPGIVMRRELDFLFTSEMAYIPVEQEEFIALMPADLLLFWLFLATLTALFLRIIGKRRF